MIRHARDEKPISQWMGLEELTQEKLLETLSFHQKLISWKG
jgi:hypothetical protein